jgi:O-antigen ligase
VLELLNNPYFTVFLALLIIALVFIVWWPEAIPAFLFLLLSGIGLFFLVANVQKVDFLKAFLLPPLLLYLLLRKMQNGDKLPLQGIVWITAYAAFVILSCLINRADLNEYRAYFGILMVPLVVALCPNNEKTVKYLTIAFAFWGFVNLLVVLATLAGFGWAQRFITSDETNFFLRFQGLMGLSTHMGIYFAISLSAFQVLYYLAETRMGRLFYFALGVSMALGLIGTVSVGAFVGWVASLLFIHHQLRRFTTGSLIIIGGSVVLLLLLAAFLKQEAMLERLCRISTDQSALGRITLLQMGITRFVTSPIFGVGLGQGGKLHLETHNTYMQVLMENGLVGFLVFCGILWNGWRRLYRQARQDGKETITPTKAYYVGILGSLTAILVDGLVHVFDFFMPLWLILGIAFMV